MRVVNIHQRTIPESIEKVSALLQTLATPDDQVWPKENWPPMRLKDGLAVGSKGGHGPIRYEVASYDEGRRVRFTFLKPAGFHGYHELEVNQLSERSAQLKHTIDMNARGIDILSWTLGIRWLHDALIEDAFDKVEARFSGQKLVTPWNFWVRFLRKLLKA